LQCLLSILHNGIVPLEGLLFRQVPEEEGHVIRCAALDLWILRVDPANACLWRGTEAVALSQSFDVLHYLVQHPNRVVTKDELLDAVWPETAVTDAVVRAAIGILRKVWTTRRTPTSSPPCRAGGIASWRR
jgi:DNA-binding response OmpR family regulator